MHLSDFHLSDVIMRVLAAIVILIVTALIATFLKRILTKALSKAKFLNRGGSGESLAALIGTVVSAVVWIFGLMAILNLFALTQVLSPLNLMLVGLLAALPRVLAAGLVLFVGIILAKVVRELVVTALKAANVDRFASSFGGASTPVKPRGRKQQLANDGGATAVGDPSEAQQQQAAKPGPISGMVGHLVFAIIVIVMAIAALQILGIESISGPATHMLQLILDAIPLLIGAAILLGIGIVIAKFVGQLLESVLQGVDLDGMAARAGLNSGSANLSKLLARIAQIAIVLFFAIAAANMLHFPQITNILNTILALGGRVVFGAIVIAAGVFIANLVAGFLSGRTAKLVKIATIVLFAAMGLKYMGLADSIVNLAFGALVVGGAAAAALAFGLGGRDAAARQLDKVQRELEKDSTR